MIKYKSVFAQSMHAGGLGVYLLFFPEIMFDLLQLSPLTENWIRSFGILLIGISIMFYSFSRYGNFNLIKHYFMGTLVFSVCIVSMIFLYSLPFPILIVMVSNTLLPLWTYYEIRH